MLWSAERMMVDGRERLVTAMVDLTERTEAYEETLVGWARALDLRDHETAGHAVRVTHLAEALGRRSGLDEERLMYLRWGALLHDIGKIGIPDAVLNKPGRLNDEEWAMMRRHPEVAGELLRPISFLAPALDVPTCHHERWDGSGYPSGLAGEAIPRAARIFAVVDVWDALLSDRPYRPAWTRDAARAHLEREAGRLFDPAVVSAFLAMIEAGEA
jgi:putative nucleotidyltransferase with HDIG domain